MSARQGSGFYRHLAFSNDEGQTWSHYAPGQAVSPVCCAIERYTLRSRGDDRDRILWTGPKGPGRSNLVIRVSYDEGQSFATERLVYPGRASYSDLDILTDGSIGILWERGETAQYQWIPFTRLSRTFLDGAP